MFQPSWKRGAVILVGLVLALCAVSVLAGPAQKTEFSPELLEYRVTDYYPLPLTPLPLIPIRRRQYRSPLLEHIVEAGYAAPVKGKAARWDFVRGRAPTLRGWIGKARYFYYVDHELLLSWSRANPRRASIVWPIAVELVRRNRYGMAYHVVTHLRDYPVPPDQLRDVLIRETAREPVAPIK